MWQRREDMDRLTLSNYKLMVWARSLYRKLWYLLGPVFVIALLRNPQWEAVIGIGIVAGGVLILDAILTVLCWWFLTYAPTDQRP